jgi:hypothetical protein
MRAHPISQKIFTSLVCWTMLSGHSFDNPTLAAFVYTRAFKSLQVNKLVDVFYLSTTVDNVVCNFGGVFSIESG